LSIHLYYSYKAVYLSQTTNRNPEIDMTKYKEISHLIVELSCDPDVQKVSVNSTLNKRYIREKDKCLADGCEVSYKLIDDPIQAEFSEKKCKALIICNQFEMKSGMTEQNLQTTNIRRNTLTKAQTVFKEYWNFEVFTFQ